MILRLAFDPPQIEIGAIRAAVQEACGLDGDFSRLHGERDLNHCLTAPDGARYLVRVGTSSEPADRARMQAEALIHVELTDPGCPVPRILRTREGHSTGTIDGPRATHPVTIMTWLAGMPISAPPAPRLARDVGEAVGRLSRALRGFFHPAADQFVAWDVRRRLALDPEIRRNLSGEVAGLIEPMLTWAERDLPAALSQCRHQIIHGDSHMSNLLVEHGEVTGIIDFGDMMFGPVVQNLATVIASLQRLGAGRAAEAAVIAGHHGQDPLDAYELELLPQLVLFRHVTALAFYDALTQVGAERPDYAPRARARLLDLLPGRLSTSASPKAQPVEPLLKRRHKVTDPFRHAFYRDPPEFVRGEGTELITSDGRRYLDLYNNVACVGHNHPIVVEAIVAQTRQHNLNTRYLDDTIVSYAERLTACFPDGLDAAIFTCTGSEANDLALRFARRLTGHKGLIAIDTAYHGNTDLVRKLTSGGDCTTATIPFPKRIQDLEPLEVACDGFRKAGIGVAALIVDPIFVSSGLMLPEQGVLIEAARIVRRAGGLMIADEVQSGFFRTGPRMWGFQLHDFVPDLVTLGKPMGNGYPIGGVVFSSQMQPQLARGPRYFNTFAGNPVAAAAGAAVLRVLEEEDIGAHVGRMHAVLKEGLTEALGPPSGSGLAWSVPMGSAQAAEAMVERLFAKGLLAGTVGPARDRLRIRPPLIFGDDEAERLFEALGTATA